MISSSNFFNKSFFRPQEPQSFKQHDINFLKKDYLTPWTNIQQSPLMSVQVRPTQQEQNKKLAMKRRQHSMKISSNLLKSDERNQQLQFPYSTNPYYAHKQSKRQEKIKSTLPLLSQRVKNNVRSMSIRQFLDEQKNQLSNEKYIEKKTIATINNSLEHNFLIRRGQRRKGKQYGDPFKTIDIHRDLVYPLELLEKREVLSFNPENNYRDKQRRGYGILMDKYRPIRSKKERYHL